MSPSFDPHARLRLTLGGALPATLVALAVVPLVALWSQLPEPMATHWSLSGEPDGSMSRLTALAVQGGLTLLPAGLALALSRRRPARLGELALGLAGAVAAAGFFALLSAVVVVANLAHANWRQADLPAMAVVPAFGVAVALGWATARLARRLEEAAPAPTPEREATTVGLEGTERAAWVGVVSSRWALPMATACVGAGALDLVLTTSFAGIALLIISAAIATFTSVRVSVGAPGVHVSYGRLGWPSTRIAIRDIRRASAIDVRPSAWGGWGYRGSLRMTGKAAVVLRAGEGLRLDLEGNRVFVVTVDEAELAAGVLNDELRRVGRLERG